MARSWTSPEVRQQAPMASSHWDFAGYPLGLAMFSMALNFLFFAG
jgi:hypothetical protein